MWPHAVRHPPHPPSLRRFFSDEQTFIRVDSSDSCSSKSDSSVKSVVLIVYSEIVELCFELILCSEASIVQEAVNMSPLLYAPVII